MNPLQHVTMMRLNNEKARGRLSALKKQLSKGFTLVEIIMVMGILALLSAVMLPNFTALQLKAKGHSMHTIGRTLQISIESYYLDNGVYPSQESLKVEGLIELLKSKKILTQSLANPYTNEAFSDEDSSGKILYAWDADNQQYTLELYGENNAELVLTLQNG